MKWFDVKNLGQKGEIYIYGEITMDKWWDTDVTPTEIVEKLKELENVDEIDIYVNSPGGSVYAGLAIYNALKRIEKTKTAYIDGVAASITSLIVLAADKVVMPSNSMVMIHNPWTGPIYGEAKDMRKSADDLDRVKEKILLPAYQEKTGLDLEKLSEMMDDETWLSGIEAKELGFADIVEEENKIAACYSGKNVKFNNITLDLERFSKFPKDKFEEHQVPEELSTTNSHRCRYLALSAQL